MTGEPGQDYWERCDRQLRLAGFDRQVQFHLAQAHVLLVGAGGLGCPAAMALSRAGLGTLSLVDPDTVSLDNLARQLLYEARDVGRAKVDCAREQLAGGNPDLCLHTRQVELSCANADELLAGCDVVLECTDRVASKLLLNDACVAAGIPLVYAEAMAWRGQVTTILPGHSACLRCLFPDTEEPHTPDITSRDVGIFGPLANLLGLLQASEAIQLLALGAAPLTGLMCTIDIRSMDVRTIRLQRDQDCKICGSCE